MRRILILDDSFFRHNVFRTIYDDSFLVHVYRYSEAVRELEKGDWDIVHLDHDLGDFLPGGMRADTYEDGWGKTQLYTGRHVAEKLIELPEALWPKAVVVHSVNGIGGRAIMEVIQSTTIPVTWVPFDPNPEISERLAKMAERQG